MPKQTDEVLMMSCREPAVYLREACLTFDSNEPVVVLDHLDLTLPRGAIYGLLGASGCGKTSLLTCIVGIRKLKSGQIAVLGGEPGSPGSGTKYGYMPQETALMCELTTTNVMFYYGRIYGMSSDVIMERIKYLSCLLDLPATDVRIEHLSGGEQRRVSLAVSLLHDPELLVLDEPTIGLNPVLRQRAMLFITQEEHRKAFRMTIWDYLKMLAEVENKSIILTTHYIEEARRADVVGLMRQGKLLAESSPYVMMDHFSCQTLEQVFVKLSHEQSQHDVGHVTSRPAVRMCRLSDTNIAHNLKATCAEDKKSEDISQQNVTALQNKLLTKASIFDKLRALIIKNLRRDLRSFNALLYLIIVPLVVINLFFLGIGNNPGPLLLAVVNDELPISELAGTCRQSHVISDMSRLSCRYLNMFNPDDITLRYFLDQDSAMRAVKAGHVRGVLHFGSNFSTALNKRIRQGFSTSDLTLAQSEVEVWLDMTDYHIGLMLKKSLYDKIAEITTTLLVDCELQKLAKYRLPIKFEEPIYGSRNPNMKTFMFPGITLGVIFTIGMGLTCTSMTADVIEGIWNRDRIAGVTSIQVMISLLITHSVLILAETSLCLMICFLIYGEENQGSIVLVFVVTALQGLCGVTYGIFLSFICDTIFETSYFAACSSFSLFILTGTIWPLQGTPSSIVVLCQQLPLTSGIVAMRSIVTKGWGVYHPVVLENIVRSVVWMLAFVAATLLTIRTKH